MPLRVRLSTRSNLCWGCCGRFAEQRRRTPSCLTHQYVGLADLQQFLAGVGELFDTLLVFENYPLERDRLAASAGALRLRAVEGHDGAHYALDVAVIPGRQLKLRFDYRADLFDRGSVEGIGARFCPAAVVVDML